jgi:hypothetical protein
MPDKGTMKHWSWKDSRDGTSNWNWLLSFFWFPRFASWCNMNVWCHVTCRPIRFSPKEKGVPNIYGIRLVGGKVTLIPVVSSSGMTYANMVSIPTEEHNRYMTYITNYPPSDADAFNAARPTLHTLQERIHVLRKWPQDIPRSPCPRCAIMTSCTTDTQPLSHDRDCL